MTSSQCRNTGPMLSTPRCGAKTRSGNKNALKHGAYTQEAIERRKGIRDFIRKSRDLIVSEVSTLLTIVMQFTV
jgi:hypothetical protein